VPFEEYEQHLIEKYSRSKTTFNVAMDLILLDGGHIIINHLSLEAMGPLSAQELFTAQVAINKLPNKLHTLNGLFMHKSDFSGKPVKVERLHYEMGEEIDAALAVMEQSRSNASSSSSSSSSESKTKFFGPRLDRKRQFLPSVATTFCRWPKVRV
jgi:hypothetical protein